MHNNLVLYVFELGPKCQLIEPSQADAIKEYHHGWGGPIGVMCGMYSVSSQQLARLFSSKTSHFAQKKNPSPPKTAKWELLVAVKGR